MLLFEDYLALSSYEDDGEGNINEDAGDETEEEEEEEEGGAYEDDM